MSSWQAAPITEKEKGSLLLIKRNAHSLGSHMHQSMVWLVLFGIAYLANLAIVACKSWFKALHVVWSNIWLSKAWPMTAVVWNTYITISKRKLATVFIPPDLFFIYRFGLSFFFFKWEGKFRTTPNHLCSKSKLRHSNLLHFFFFCICIGPAWDLRVYVFHAWDFSAVLSPLLCAGLTLFTCCYFSLCRHLFHT